MTISNQEEYKLQNGQTISMQQNESNGKWEVACWNKDDTAHWYKEFDNFELAAIEFSRWQK